MAQKSMQEDSALVGFQSQHLDCVGFDALSQHMGLTKDAFGVVSSMREPAKSKAGTQEWNISMTVCDPSRPSDHEGVRVMIFAPSLEQLPGVRGGGDVILITSLRVGKYNGRIQCTSNFRSKYMVWRDLGHVPQHPSKTINTTKEIEQHAQGLGRWWKKLTTDRAKSGSDPNTVTVVAAKPSRPLAKASELQAGQYRDLYVQVLKSFPQGRYIEMHVTDYTMNEALKTREFGTKWKGPYGKYTLTVFAWDATNDYCSRNIGDGDYVLLQNVYGKLDLHGYLEGKIHGDHKYAEKVFVKKLDRDHPNIVPIIMRKDKYEAAFRAKFEDHQNLLRQQEAEERKTTTPAPKLNSHVECGFATVGLSSICDVLHRPMPAQPKARRIRVLAKPVDFLPRRIEDFAQPFCPACRKFIQTRCPTCGIMSRYCQYRWKFAILLQGQDRTTLPMILVDRDAQVFLNDEALVPSDLDHNPIMARKLKVRMAQLWNAGGDHNREVPHENAPFAEFCLAEYYAPREPPSQRVNAKRRGDTLLSERVRRWQGFGVRMI